MRASGSACSVLAVALASALITLAITGATAAADNPYAGTWVGDGRLEGHGACASAFTLRFQVTESGALSGRLDMERGSHGFAGDYGLSGSVDENDGRLTNGRAAKSWTIELYGNFSAQSVKGTAVFGGEANCYGDWTAQRESPTESATKAAPSKTQLAPPERPDCGDAADTRRRLEAIDRLLKGGLITEAEATAKRQQVLECL